MRLRSWLRSRGLTMSDLESYMDFMRHQDEEAFLAMCQGMLWFEEEVQETRPGLSFYISKMGDSVRLSSEDQSEVVGVVPLYVMTPGELLLACRNLALLAIGIDGDLSEHITAQA